MPKQPANPEPAYGDLDQMLSRKFGKEVANYFSGSPLNRLGFLRADHIFLSKALRHPSTSFLLCNGLQPLISTSSPDRLAYVKYEDVRPIIGDDPYATTEKDMLAAYDSTKFIPQMIFLGIDEKAKDALTYKGKNEYTGAPYFAIDVTPQHNIKEECEKLIEKVKTQGKDFAKGRVMDILASDAAIYAEARQLLDWNARNPFCAACGNRTMSINGGFKRTCPPTDKSLKGNVSNALPNAGATDTQDNITRPPCATRTGISNLCFPRTDPTVIMAVVNSAGDKILLGRQKRWPPHWYSTLAGFAEPAESIEEAVRREVYEESGVLVGRVVIHSTQPWPYPANLMIGAVGQAVPDGETIDLGNDPELDDARWFPFDEVRQALRFGTSGLGEDAGPEYKEGGLRLPPPTAIANQLMTSVVSGFANAVTKL